MRDSTKYIFDQNTGNLYVSGKGAISDYTNDLAPWSSYKHDIISVIIEGEVSSVGNNCFSECTGLTSVTIISSSIESLGESTFSGCSNLEKITFQEGANLSIIGESTFYKCYNLESLVIPGLLYFIGNHAFCNCTKLNSAIFLKPPKSHESIVNYVLSFLSMLPVKLYNKITGNDSNFKLNFEIKEYTFYGCKNLKTVEFFDDYHFQSIGNNAFEQCSSLESFILQSSIKSI